MRQIPHGIPFAAADVEGFTKKHGKFMCVPGNFA